MPRKFAAASAIHDQPELALDRALSQIAEQIGGSIDLLFVFTSGYDTEDIDQLIPSVRQRADAKHLLGCHCETVINGQQELEQEHAVSMWAAVLPEAELTSMHLQYERGYEQADFVGMPTDLDGAWASDTTSLVLFSEPFEFPVDVFLEQLNEKRPGLQVSGGVASSAHTPGDARLFLNDEVLREGAVALRIANEDVRTVVSQGCRPIGEPFVITGCERNTIQELGGYPALAKLREIFKTLPARDQQLVHSGLQVGRVLNEYRDKFEYGDFLIRNVVGVDTDEETIAIGDFVRRGQTIQFHVRDHQSASSELSLLLAKQRDQNAGAALIFSCNGRGTRLFPEPHHDAMMLQKQIGPVPLAGFFAAGELGTVGNQTFLHGLTASVLIFGA